VIKDLKAGDPVSVGPYRLLGRLGAGGMGQVYLAKSPGGRLVAIKLIRPELAEERGFRARFAAEIAAARDVSGIYTAAVVDADAGADAELPWMATVYVPGPSLTDAVDDNGPLPVKSVLALAAGLAEALEAIHRVGLVHRDLKPSNVLLAADGPRVIDFGISRAVERSMMTATGMVLGSPGFMSPEQATGGQVGPPTDVFSLGAILAFASTGDGPFGAGPTPALLYRVVREEPDLTQVPSRLRPLIEQCLAKDPASRPTPADLLASLSDDVGVLTGEWLPETIADGMSRYSPTLLTPPPPSLREPDSVPLEPVPAASPQSGSATPVAATVADASLLLPDTSLVLMPGATGGRDIPGGTGPAAASPAGPPPPPHRRRWRWPYALVAAVVIIAAVAAVALTQSSGSGPKKGGPIPTASLAGDATQAPASPTPGTATPSKIPTRRSSSTAAGNAPGTRPSSTPGYASSPAAAKTPTPTATRSPTPTTKPTTATPTSSPTTTPTSSPTTTPTTTPTSSPTTTPTTTPTSSATTPTAASSSSP
jgi:eukaryotic-like serine/threonine-protein kinase